MTKRWAVNAYLRSGAVIPGWIPVTFFTQRGAERFARKMSGNYLICLVAEKRVMDTFDKAVLTEETR